MTHEILLYYKYANIKNPLKFSIEHRDFCAQHNLTGRIIVASEGINGTVEGLRKDTRAYRRFLNAKAGFKKVNWKISPGTGRAFPRMSIKLRPEIVSLSLVKNKDTDIDPRKMTGTYLKPAELKKWFDRGLKFTIIDMRNTYEHKVGAFEGSILPALQNFRDLPKVMSKLKKFAGEKVLTVCTGGVRCEKASGYLIKQGFKDVYQLDGGIVSFMEKYPGEHFKGALYVFDGRVTMYFDPKKASIKREIIGICDKCGDKSENYLDCNNQSCGSQFICCQSCVTARKIYCSEKCKKSTLVRIK